jgi:hypothetical protein
MQVLYNYVNLSVQHIGVSGLCSWFGVKGLFSMSCLVLALVLLEYLHNFYRKFSY